MPRKKLTTDDLDLHRERQLRRERRATYVLRNKTRIANALSASGRLKRKAGYIVVDGAYVKAIIKITKRRVKTEPTQCAKKNGYYDFATGLTTPFFEDNTNYCASLTTSEADRLAKDAGLSISGIRSKYYRKRKELKEQL